ncbi:MAG: hypothetical protein ACOH1H_14950 [Brevundimonas sp.]
MFFGTHNCGMDALPPKPFRDAARRAFPFGMSALANEAASELSPFVDDAYRQRSEAIDVTGQMVAIPRRLHFAGLSVTTERLSNFNPASRCLITRATDGRLRQQALRSVIDHQSAWVAPFVLMLLGEYVIEIVEDIRDALPVLDQSVYANLVRENRQTVQKLRARATSYWDAYHRPQYPQKRDYPGLQALHEMETWAA